MERINTRKRDTINNVQCSKCQSNFISYLNVTDPLIIPSIFIFLSCREKAHDNKEFSCEN